MQKSLYKTVNDLLIDSFSALFFVSTNAFSKMATELCRITSPSSEANYFKIILTAPQNEIYILFSPFLAEE